MIEKNEGVINTMIDLKTRHYSKLTKKSLFLTVWPLFGHFLDVYEKFQVFFCQKSNQI